MRAARYPIASLLALAIVIALFRLMSALVGTGAAAAPPAAVPAALERVRIVAEPTPEPPPPPTPRRAVAALAPAAAPLPPAPALPALGAQTLPLPAVDLDLRIAGRTQGGAGALSVAAGDALAAFSGSQSGFTGAELVPVASARPRYPRSAATRGIEGWVELLFVVTGGGRVENVRVLDASPRGVFEDAAVDAMRNWVYAPHYVGGRAVAREGTQLIRFRLEDIHEDYLWDD